MHGAAMARHGLILSQHGATVITMLLDTSLTTLYAILDQFLTKIIKHLKTNIKKQKNI